MRVKADEIEIAEHSAEWRREFAQIGAALRSQLEQAALRIDHIGSTAVPGLAAKPIIDIQISVASLEPMDSYLGALRSLGYVWRDANPERTKRYFREAPGTRRTHIHVRQRGSWNEQFALLFRDYLRESEDERARYEAVKRELAEQFRTQRQRYSEGKISIIWQIIHRADRWAATTGWQPGPSDA